MVDNNRLAVTEIDLIDVPGAARRATSQWRDLQFYCVAGLEALARPSLPHQAAGALAFEVPGLDATVFLFDHEKDEGVGVGELEVLHDAFEFDRVVLIEHREGMMRRHPAACGDSHGAHQQSC